ncbi:MAG: right-handed parallel beta-helix repeat-containing protein, partial [Anaerolineales bacterium]|nr:right-handed parallel beta-helix repeat-containing protein [Anaerolineales bacterium]
LDVAEVLLVDTAGGGILASSRYAADGGSAPAPAAAALDLSGNQVVNQADAYLVVSAWRELARGGACLHPNVAAYDVNGSGCLSVADVQLILAAWGQPAGARSVRPAGGRAPQAAFIVNSDQDGGDAAPGDGQCQTAAGVCTLRAAIEEANVLPGADAIYFNVRNGDGSCPGLVTIQPAGMLIIDAADNAGITVNGYTQCGAAANNDWVNGNAVIKIELRGTDAAFVHGLQVLSPDNKIKGLAIFNWHRQIQLLGSNAHDNIVEGNFLGTDAANAFRHGSSGFEGEGLRIELGASNNLVGGTTPAARNVISGNDQDGLGLQGAGVIGNQVFNNYIGLKQNGTERLRNTADGVDIAEGVADNEIGGLAPGERNVISGNNRDGVEISHDVNTTNNHVAGNFIGVNPAGTAGLYNGDRGLAFEDNVTGNQVYRNVIAANGGDGARFYTVFDNALSDNYIGVLPTGLGPLDVVPVPGSEAGLLALPNGSRPTTGAGLSGVYMMGGSQGNSVTHSIIAYHPEYGIYLNAEEGYLSYGTCETYYNTFSQNSLYENGAQGIRLRSDVCSDGNTYHPNQGLAAPQLTTATTSQVTGVSCAGCVVEVYESDKTVVDNPGGDNSGEGKDFVAQGTADAAGGFTIAVTGIPVGAILTAHASDGAGNTSAFARNVAVVSAPPPTRTPTPPPPPTHTNTPTHTPTPTP